MRVHLSSRFAKNIAVTVAALAIAGTAAGTAGAETTCTGQPIVDRPGEHHVTGGPAHQGDITIGLSAPIAPMTVGQPYEFTLNEYNGTGAAYQNVAVMPFFYGWTEVSAGRLDGMTPDNTHLQTLVNGAWVNVPLRDGCDPTMTTNSTVVDHALPAGGHWKQTFRLTIDATVSPKLTSFQLGDMDYADGTSVSLEPNIVQLVHPAARATTPSATATPSTAAPAPRTKTAPTKSAAAKATPSTPAAAAPAQSTPSAAGTAAATPATPATPAPQPSTAAATPSAAPSAASTNPALKTVAASSAGSGVNGTGLLVGGSILVAGLAASLGTFRRRRGVRG